MNFSLLDSILRHDDAVLATIIGARGHTYKKTGQQALYAPGRIEPVHGNLGALCADQEIAARAREARTTGKPLAITIDTSRPMDELMGSGTGCGGELRLLLEPLDETHRRTYALLESHLMDGPTVFLVHEIESGALWVEAREPAPSATYHVERIDALVPIVLVGATPLARRLIALAADMDVVAHLVDWRQAFLDLFSSVPRLRRHTALSGLSPRACVVIMSHSYERDLAALRSVLDAGCGYVGLLSSRSRRDRMFEALEGEGYASDALARIHSPVGIDIGAQTDAEIAVSIMAEIVRHLRS